MDENTTTATPEDDLRSSLAEAFEEKAPEPEQTESETPAETPEPAPEAEKPAETGEKEPLNAENDEKSAKTPEEGDKSRDEKGRFASKDEKEGVKPAEKVGQPPEQPERTEKDPIAKAPEAWKPEAREYWKDIPDEAKKEIIRHNQLVYETLDKTAKERKFAQAVAKTVEPYRATIEGEGSNVVQAIGQLMQTAQALRTAPGPQKAQLVAGVIQQFGVDIQALDKALAGQKVEPDPVAERIERELAPVRQWQQQMTQQQQYEQQQQEQQLQSKVQEFYATEPEFLNDVRDRMVQIYDGQMDLKTAYDEACWATPEVRKVLLQRQEAQRLQQQNEVASKAKNAAVSVGGAAPVANPNQESPSSIREALELAVSRSVR